MAFEKKLAAVAPQSFVSDGTVDGKVTLVKPWLFKVGQKVYLQSGTLNSVAYEVHRVDPDGSTLSVGPPNTSNTVVSDITAFTVSSGAVIFAVEQPRPIIPSGAPFNLSEEFEKTEHEEEPVVAKRVILVDQEGEKIDSIVQDGLRRIAVQTQPITGGGGGSGVLVAPDATNLYGSSTGVAISASSIMILSVADALYRFSGFTVRGTSDARFEVKYDGVVKYVLTTSITNPVATLVLPNPDPAAASTTVTVVVTNLGTDIGNFEGTLFGFELPTGATTQTPPTATNSYNSITAVPPTNTATVLTYVAGAGFKFQGYTLRGTADAQISVKFNGVKKYFGVTSITQPVDTLVLPSPDATAGGTTVTIEIINNGIANGDYEATLFGL